MDLGLLDRVAVVLASTAGLGLACARELAAEGARVAISGRDPERLARALGALGGAGERLLGEALDVTDPLALARHLEAVRARWGTVHVLVVNGGGPPVAAAVDVDVDGLYAAARTTLASGVHAVRTVLPWMRAQRHGRIVALTSIAVRQPLADLAYSNVMRAGLTAYLKTLADEVGRDGVLVNSVCTGSFATDRLASLFEARAAKNGTSAAQERARAEAAIPLGRAGDPAELAALVAFLASDRASYLTGAALPCDGGAYRGLL